MNNSFVLVLAALFFASLAGCMCMKQESAGRSGEHPADYHGNGGSIIKAGRSQSPINIETLNAEPVQALIPIRLDYHNPVIGVLGSGRPLKLVSAGTAILDGQRFDLQQLHFHSSSEHTVDGKHYPIELHFVNKAEDGQVAVVAVFLKSGKENPTLEAMHKQSYKTAQVESGESVGLRALLPSDLSYYHNDGSLTTPPFSENVERYVMKSPVEVSRSQIELFKYTYALNNRSIQPLNGRRVIVSIE
ncbi:carbonic anhydrase family protein [Ectopseudomonas mendocina]|uniref:Carbonic anhydrase n=1 Tax=Ectopseudomonas mendocina TaxID=300 RepID=A0ABZ2RJP4_ECTME